MERSGAVHESAHWGQQQKSYGVSPAGLVREMEVPKELAQEETLGLRNVFGRRPHWDRRNREFARERQEDAGVTVIAGTVDEHPVSTEEWRFDDRAERRQGIA